MAADKESLIAPRKNRAGAIQGCLAACTGALLTFAAPLNAADTHVMTFGGAGVFGNYYAIANAICDEIDLQRATDVRCSPESTAGSLYNIHALNRKELDFALVQSDWHRQAVEGTGAFTSIGPQTDLRSLISLFAEAFTVVVRRDADINVVTDLEGKKIDIGHPTTARRGTVDRLLADMQIPSSFFGEIRTLSGNIVTSEICSGRVDAVVLVIGHPNANLAKVMQDCDLKIIPVQGPRIGDFIAQNSDYSPFEIPANTYDGMEQAIPTFSVSATLVTRVGVSDSHVKLVLDTVLERYSQLQESVGALPEENSDYDRQSGLTAPLHPLAATALTDPKP